MFTIFLILHILCAAIWFALGLVNMLLMRQAVKAKGTAAELSFMSSQALAGRVMGMIGGIGILLTGGAITGIMHFGWFPFGTSDWLATKQVIFVILLIISFAVVMPVGKKIDAMIASEQAGPNASRGASQPLREAMNKLKTFGIIMNLLVLINIILGVWKPVF